VIAGRLCMAAVSVLRVVVIAVRDVTNGWKYDMINIKDSSFVTLPKMCPAEQMGCCLINHGTSRWFCFLPSLRQAWGPPSSAAQQQRLWAEATRPEQAHLAVELFAVVRSVSALFSRSIAGWYWYLWDQSIAA
jgi:hypothetical protein